MKLPRMRFTVRRLMLAVLAAAIAIQGWVLWRRSAGFANMVVNHERKLRNHIFNRKMVYVTHVGGEPDFSRELPPVREADRAYLDLKIKHEEQLVSKYRRAMAFPWISVESDPPEPKYWHE
jgi:hypothetical protein